MTSPRLLGPLNTVHQMLVQVVETAADTTARRQYHPDLGSLKWYLGRSAYLETYWLRERIDNDDDLTARVRDLFEPGALPLAEQCSRLPPADHLLNWVLEIQEENLLRMANPAMLPDNPLMENDRLPWFLLQEQARLFEQMLMVMNQRSLQELDVGYQVRSVLASSPPEPTAADVCQGHYRIGARDDPAARDDQLPPQVVELSSYRITREPVSNAEWLGFMQAGGYQDKALWTPDGWNWCTSSGVNAPEYWRRDNAGNWFGVGINGPFDLHSAEPLLGINQYEAHAYANHAAQRLPGFEGAVLPHEYQWETAARLGLLESAGRAWEWCSNRFHAYDGYQPFPPDRNTPFADDQFSQRGGSLHTQPALRRPSYRGHSAPDRRFGFAGLRLVLPPG